MPSGPSGSGGSALLVCVVSSACTGLRWDRGRSIYGASGRTSTNQGAPWPRQTDLAREKSEAGSDERQRCKIETKGPGWWWRRTKMRNLRVEPFLCGGWGHKLNLNVVGTSLACGRSASGVGSASLLAQELLRRSQDYPSADLLRRAKLCLTVLTSKLGKLIDKLATEWIQCREKAWCGVADSGPSDASKGLNCSRQAAKPLAEGAWVRGVGHGKNFAKHGSQKRRILAQEVELSRSLISDLSVLESRGEQTTSTAILLIRLAWEGEPTTHGQTAAEVAAPN